MSDEDSDAQEWTEVALDDTSDFDVEDSSTSYIRPADSDNEASTASYIRPENVVQQGLVEEQPVEELATEQLPVRAEVMVQAQQAASALDGLLANENFGPPRAQQAFRDFINLGKGRSLKRLAETYADPQCTSWTNNFESVYRMLKDYSRNYHWQDNLRMFVAKASAEVLAAAQRDAFVHAKQRIEYAREAQQAGRIIIEKAQLEKLTVAEARTLLKPAATLLQLGLTSERAEQGDVLAVIRPDKPVEQMSEQELDEFAHTLQKAIQ